MSEVALTHMSQYPVKLRVADSARAVHLCACSHFRTQMASTCNAADVGVMSNTATLEPYQNTNRGGAGRQCTQLPCGVTVVPFFHKANTA